MKDLPRNGAKRAQEWLRSRRRLERMLRRGRLSGPQTLYSHELVVPLNSTYAPWHDDREFREVYDAVEGSTLVDQYKCYELWEQLGQLVHVDGDILEVGVWRGGTGVLMARRVQQLGTKARLLLCDTFQGVAKAGENDPWYKGGEHSDTSPEHVRGLARRLGVDVELLIGMFPDETSEPGRGRLPAPGAHRRRRLRLRPRHARVGLAQTQRRRAGRLGRLRLLPVRGRRDPRAQLFDADLGAAGRLVHNINGHLLLIKTSDAPLPALATPAT